MHGNDAASSQRCDHNGLRVTYSTIGFSPLYTSCMPKWPAIMPNRVETRQADHESDRYIVNHNHSRLRAQAWRLLRQGHSPNYLTARF